MVVLTISLDVAPENQQPLQDCFTGQFVPAVRRQPGFVDVQLARPLGGSGAEGMLVLLYFETERQRQAWVATPEHETAWNAMAALCRGFTPVSHEVLAGAR